MFAPHDIERRPIGVRAVFGLAWPVMVSMLSYTAMTVADTVYVGQLGTLPVAAVGLSGVVAFLVVSFGAGLTNGVKVVVSHRIGADEPIVAARLGWQGLYLGLGLGLLALLLLPFGDVIFASLADEPTVVADASAYFSIRTAATPIVFAMMAISAYFQGSGDTRTPMLASLLANVGNILLDPLFIFGAFGIPAYGVAGAAWATDLAQAGGLLFLVFRYRKAIRGVPAGWSRVFAKEVWSVGAPIGIRWTLDVASYVVFTAILARVGAAELAAHIIVVRIISISFLPGNAIGEAASVLVGQSIGAKHQRGAIEAHHAATRLAVGVMLAWGVVFVLAPGLLVALFNAEPDVADTARTLLLIAAGFQLFDALAMVAQSSINGVGDTKFVMVSSVLVGWGVKLPVGYIMAVPAGFGAVGAWMGLTAEIVVIAGLSMYHIHSGNWLRAPLATSES